MLVDAYSSMRLDSYESALVLLLVQCFGRVEMGSERLQATQKRFPATVSEQFEYQPLPGASHFRVLALDPGNIDSPLSCKLKVVFVQTARQSDYQALSYTWGNNDEPLKPFISCHGKCLKITSNLESALRHIRSEKEMTNLWVDQICINQDDFEERSQQVSLMSSIYSLAKRVIIWLGEADSTSNQAMTLVPLLYHNLCLHFESQGTDFLRHNPYGKRLEGTEFIFPGIESSLWTALTHLLNRRWFQRVWVAQEATANSETIVRCGQDHIAWSMLTNLLHLLDTQTHAAQVLYRRWQASDSISFLKTLRAFVSDTSEPRSQDLLTVIKAFSEQLSTDPRDRVFAVLGFVHDFKGTSLAPNYSLDVKDVFFDLACQCLKNGYGLEVLHYANMTDDGTKRELPSWVPDWRHQPHERTVGSKMIRRLMFTAASAQKVAWRLDSPNGVLTVRGRRICNVTDRGVLYPIKQSFDAYSERDTIQMNAFMNQALIHEFLEKAAAMAQVLAGNGRSGEDILCSVLTRDYWGVSCGLTKALRVMRLLRDTAASGRTIFEAYSALPRGSYIQEHFMDYEDPTVVHWRKKHFSHIYSIMAAGKDLANNSEIAAQVFLQQLRGNRIASTSEKMLANVPEHTNEGDEIWIIYGCRTPFLLRPTERGYLMVGECFVDGIMDGQALERDMGIERDASLV